MDFLSFSGLIEAIVILVVILGFGGAFVVVVVANRADPDPSGRRPYVVYLFGVAFITLWTALFGSIEVVLSVVQLIGSHRGPGTRSLQFFGTSLHPIGDAAARGATLGGLVLVVSLVAMQFHVRRGLHLTVGDPDPSSPATWVARSYVVAVAFVSILVLVAALVVAIYLVFELAGPGVFGGGGHIPTLRYLIDAGYVAIAAGCILWWHLNIARGQLWPWRARHGGPAPAPGSAPPPQYVAAPGGPAPYPQPGPAVYAPAAPAQPAAPQYAPGAVAPAPGQPGMPPALPPQAYPTEALPPLPRFGGQPAAAPQAPPPPPPPPPAPPYTP